VYGERDIFRPERSRVAYKQWKLAKAQGHEAEGFARKALDLYGEIHKKHDKQRRIEELKDEDFDKSIMFWSR
jgi:hypothetical protein